jgi:hypothetical protein
MIHVDKLRIGDVVGTTDLSFLSSMIKLRTWGWCSMLSQSKCSHIATVVQEHGLFYLMEMEGKGITESDVNKYDHSPPRAHICFVGRHPVFNRMAIQLQYNDYMLLLHEKHVKYGFEDIANFVLEEVGIRLHDKQDTLICSELPRVGFAKCGIPYPQAWEKDCSPENWQVWPDLPKITSEIVG